MLTLSPHEQRIKQGEPISLTDEVSRRTRARVNNMLSVLMNDPPRVAIERAHLMTNSFKETEGFPISVRWAKALENIAINIPIFIDENELIVGRCGLGERIGLIYPELRAGWLKQLEALPNRKGGQFYITNEDLEIVKDVIIPYWKGKTWHEEYYNQLPQETRNIIWDKKDIYSSKGILNAITTQDSGLIWALDYQKVLERGFLEIKKQFIEKISQINIYNKDHNYDKLPFYESVIITCDAIVVWANRYSELAYNMAINESNKKRKEELLNISEICKRVPAHPARSFHEAVQAVWFVNAFSRFEQIVAGQMGLGRLDQYLYPYYENEIIKNSINDNQAIELLECLWLNLSRIRRLVQSSSIGNYQGYPHFEQVCLGGQTKDGLDATNSLSHLILQSKKEFPLDFPDLSARIHSLTPESFLLNLCDLIREGTGFPKLYNDEEIIPIFLAKGATLEEARDYTGCGCAEVRLNNRETYMTQGCQVNVAATLEMTLKNGKMPLINEDKNEVGLETGDPTMFKSWDDFWSAFVAQLENLIKHAFINRYIGDITKPHFLAAPLQSCLHDLCVEQGQDIHQGQGKFKNDISLGNIFIVGFGTLVDSLAAIKYLVFDKKKISMDRMIKALDRNFEGEGDEIVRQMCLNAPKYGNAKPYVDSIGKNIDLILCHLTDKFNNPWNGKDNISYVPVTSHVGLGTVVGATPNGRKAKTALSEGVSPTQGCDTDGPTTLLVSIKNTKNSYMKSHEARLLNVKFTPQAIADEKGRKDLAAFIRTWCDMKHWHIQFNVVNSDTLIAAQKEPDKYRNLLVRVAGFSANFIELSPELQNEIIDRTEHLSL